MTVIVITAMGVLVADQAAKLALRRHLGTRRLSLGVFGDVRMQHARMWIERAGARSDWRALFALWCAGATALMFAVTQMPGLAPFVGLFLGGSLSHAIETAWHGTVLDYVCLRFWPAFNLADAAITVGGIATMAYVIRALMGV